MGGSLRQLQKAGNLRTNTLRLVMRSKLNKLNKFPGRERQPKAEESSCECPALANSVPSPRVKRSRPQGDRGGHPTVNNR